MEFLFFSGETLVGKETFKVQFDDQVFHDGMWLPIIRYLPGENVIILSNGAQIKLGEPGIKLRRRRLTDTRLIMISIAIALVAVALNLVEMFKQ